MADELHENRAPASGETFSDELLVEMVLFPGDDDVTTWISTLSEDLRRRARDLPAGDTTAINDLSYQRDLLRLKHELQSAGLTIFARTTSVRRDFQVGALPGDFVSNAIFTGSSPSSSSALSDRLLPPSWALGFRRAGDEGSV
jgi:hypothetical protein